MRNMKCKYCNRKGEIFIPYARLTLCKEHFIEFIQRKVLRTIKRYNLIKPGDKILVAVSGGKDSITLLQLLSEIRKTINYDLYVLHVDLGIGEYSKSSRTLVESYTKQLGFSIIILELKKILGYTIPEIAKKLKRPPCSVCGIIKRYLFNATAIELKATALATGHNLDDIATFILKEFLAQNLTGIWKLQPYNESYGDIVAARIKPLYETYEEEIRKYAEFMKLPYMKEKCPYYKPTTLDNVLKKKIKEIEEGFPGITIGLIRRFMKNIDKYPRPETSFLKCRICGLASSSEKCSYCKLTEKLLGEPMGHKTREYIKSLVEELR